MSAFALISQSALPLSLCRISVRELLAMPHLPCDIYGYRNGEFTIVLAQANVPSKDNIKTLIKSGLNHFFVPQENYKNVIAVIQSELRNIGRGFSLGDPVEKGRDHINLLSIHMGHLYENPLNDDLIETQIQNAKILARFLIRNLEIHPKLYLEFLKQKHHYIFGQPLLASLFLIGILKQSHLFGDTEMENLFLTSYLKDIGMSIIPIDKYNQETLSEADKSLLSNHAAYSVMLLKNRAALSETFLKIIEHHHLFSLIKPVGSANDIGESKTIMGFETMIISVTDILAAMISERPYRKAEQLFKALDLIKLFIADQYPQEFKLIVLYFKSFFQKAN